LIGTEEVIMAVILRYFTEFGNLGPLASRWLKIVLPMLSAT